jgi:hypothetical protein
MPDFKSVAAIVATILAWAWAVATLIQIESEGEATWKP